MEKLKKKISRKIVLIIIASVFFAGIIVYIIHRVMYVKCVVEPLDRAAQAEGFEPVIYIDEGQILFGDTGVIYEKETELGGRKGKLSLNLATVDNSRPSSITFSPDEPIIYNGRKLAFTASIGINAKLWWDVYDVSVSYREGDEGSVNLAFRTDINGEPERDEYKAKSSAELDVYRAVKNDYLEILGALKEEIRRMKKSY